MIDGYLITTGIAHGGRQALFGGEDDQILWEILGDYNTVNAIKVLTIEEANKLVEEGYKGKKVYISNNNDMLDKKFYITGPNNYDEIDRLMPKPQHDYLMRELYNAEKEEE